MRVILIFPPFSTLSGSPPAGLSSLSAYLKEHDIDVILRDLNVDFFNYFLEHWGELKDVLRDDLKCGLSNDLKTRLPHSCLHNLIQLSIPLVSQLQKEKTSGVLEHNIRHLSNVYFFDYLIHEFGYLRASLSEASSLIDQKIRDPLLIDFLGRYDWDNINLVSFSILAESQFPYAMLMALTLRNIYPHLNFVVGGPYITEIFPNLLRSKEIFDYFDYLVVYEGESALLAILDHEMDSLPITHPNVFNLHHMDHINGPFHVENLQLLPVQDFSGFDLEVYRPHDVILPVYSSKGCTWCKCAFCNTNHILNFRERDISSFVEGIIHIMRDTGISHFQIVDEDIPPARLKLLAEQIIESSPSPLRWIIQTRFYLQLDLELIALLKKAGCYSIEFGLESCSKRILQMIHKGISLKTVRRILEDCDTVGMNVILNCMVGFPSEKESDAEEMVRFLDEIIDQHPNLNVTCNTQIVKIYKNSDFGKNPKNYGIEAINPYELSPVSGWTGPEWVPHFIKKYQEHLLFAQKSSYFVKGKYSTTDAQSLLGRDPWISISDRWVFLERNEIQKEHEDKDMAYSYLVRMFEEKYEGFRLNETMEQLVRLLANEDRRLSNLKEDYINQYSGVPENQVLETLGKGLTLLNEMGAVAFHKD